MRTFLLLLAFVIYPLIFIDGQEMHRKIGINLLAGASTTSVLNGNRWREFDRSTMQISGSVGLAVRIRLSPKSSIQLSGVFNRERFRLYGLNDSDTNRCRNDCGNLDYRQFVYAGNLTMSRNTINIHVGYRYNINARLAAVLGFTGNNRLEDPTYSYRIYWGQSANHYTDGSSEVIEERALDYDAPYYYYNDYGWAGVRAGVFYQLARRWQLSLNTDHSINAITFKYRKIHLMAGYRIL